MKLKFIPYILFFLLAASCQEKGSKPDTIQQEYKPHIIDLRTRAGRTCLQNRTIYL